MCVVSALYGTYKMYTVHGVHIVPLNKTNECTVGDKRKLVTFKHKNNSILDQRYNST